MCECVRVCVCVYVLVCLCECVSSRLIQDVDRSNGVVFIQHETETTIKNYSLESTIYVCKIPDSSIDNILINMNTYYTFIL